MPGMLLLFSTASARLFLVLSVWIRLTRRAILLRAHLKLTAVTHETPRRFANIIASETDRQS